MNLAQYCRDVEAYLCRKNGGHLVRLVGPSFDRVVAWAERGVPLQLVHRGIDRYCERYHAKGPRRRPARIEYCEADVLDVFDEWRRAVGISVAPLGPDADGEPPPARRRRGLKAHVDRLVMRLTTLMALPGAPASLAQPLESTLHELERIRREAGGARGDMRARLLVQLEQLDQRLVAAARDAQDAGRIRHFRQRAEAELAPFRDRMEPPVFDQAIDRAADRLLIAELGLPQLRF